MENTEDTRTSFCTHHSWRMSFACMLMIFVMFGIVMWTNHHSFNRTIRENDLRSEITRQTSELRWDITMKTNDLRSEIVSHTNDLRWDTTNKTNAIYKKIDVLQKELDDLKHELEEMKQKE